MTEERKIMLYYRDQRKMTNADFARALRVTRQRVSGWVNGRSRPTTDFLLTASVNVDWTGLMAREILKARGFPEAEAA